MQDSKLLRWVLLINAAFFLIEIITGFLAHSMGLVADSLDMLADALVYGLSLYAVNRNAGEKKSIARLSGYFQLFLAIAGFAEVARRFAGFGEVPDYKLMMAVSFFALLGNVVCLVLLQKSKSREAHIQASRIFTANDVLINIGVIIAGVFVYLANSRIPDLVIGIIIFGIIIRGTLKIFRLSK